MPYDEPPTWYYPIRESLGGELLLAGKPADAERVFREDLAKMARNARSLFGLQAALVKQGKGQRRRVGAAPVRSRVEKRGYEIVD
jgi:hypothetical protein